MSGSIRGQGYPTGHVDGPSLATLLWIHGGAYDFGAGSDFNGANDATSARAAKRPSSKILTWGQKAPTSGPGLVGGNVDSKSSRHELFCAAHQGISPYRSRPTFSSKVERAARLAVTPELRCRSAARARPTACRCVPRELWSRHFRRHGCRRRFAGARSRPTR